MAKLTNNKYVGKTAVLGWTHGWSLYCDGK